MASAPWAQLHQAHCLLAAHFRTSRSAESEITQTLAPRLPYSLSVMHAWCMTAEEEHTPLSANAGEPLPTQLGAVFLSYASQDAIATERIATALRAAGIEVWFDKSELRGGDSWDRSIRQHIRECQLFIPVISAHTNARREGYFRREWKLAVDRTYDMSERVAFLVPIVIDDTSDSQSDVPDRFREVQWTHVLGGDSTPAFVERVRRLLSTETASPEYPPSSASRAAPAGVPMRGGPKALYAALIAAVILALGYFVLERVNRSKPRALSGASIAVLPLANESGEESQQYFSDGISEDLITALSQLSGLKVIGRTSAFQFRDSKEDSRSIGEKLGVAHLLEGSVRKSGDMIRVNAELIDTADGSTQWSERYDRPYKDLFALQDEITLAVAVALRTRLLPSGHTDEQSERPPSANLEAYNALLQARFYSARGTRADLDKAREYYTGATQLDPLYAYAWSSLSRIQTFLGANLLEGPAAKDAFGKARQAADRAIAISPNLANAHIARGFLLSCADFDWQGAEAEYRRAIALTPNEGDAKFALSSQLATLGQLEPAIELMRQALTTEPLHALWYLAMADDFSGLGRLDEAEQAVRRAIELEPNAATFYKELTVIEVQRGNREAALAAALREAPGPSQDFAIALAWQLGGQRSADAALRALIDKHAATDAYEIADLYALRKDS
jgi:TolB-like protein/Flp pilus assembly protein TadD